MTIAYDAKRLFQNFTGLGNYSRTLLKNLATYYPEHQYQLFAPKVLSHPSTQYFIDNQLFNLHNSPHRFHSWWRTFGLAKEIEQSKAHLFHGLSHEIPVGIQRNPKLKTIVTMHDLVFKIYPEYTPVLQRKVYDIKFKYACQNSDVIIAISEQTKRDIIEFYNINPNKIQVIYQTCADTFQDWTLPIPPLSLKTLPSEYMLYVGSVIERKNLLRIVEAMTILPSDLQIPLVVVGDGGDYVAKIKAFAKAKQIDHKIIWIEKMIYEELPLLYRNASVFLYPSEYEGFGIPVIEALFSKTPVITSNVSCLPEAAGLNSFLVNPKSSEAIADAIYNTLTNNDLRQKMITEGVNYAQQHFAAKKVTTEVLNLYQSIL
jgi:glycosyltransferase involved in cell wall biosynthesis